MFFVIKASICPFCHFGTESLQVITHQTFWFSGNFYCFDQEKMQNSHQVEHDNLKANEKWAEAKYSQLAWFSWETVRFGIENWEWSSVHLWSQSVFWKTKSGVLNFINSCQLQVQLIQVPFLAGRQSFSFCLAWLAWKYQ